MNSIPIIVNFNNIHPIILQIPRNSLYISLLFYVRNFLLERKIINNTSNINLYHNNQSILWYMPIGVHCDILLQNHINLTCDICNDNGLFFNPINDNVKLMIQQRLKHCLATIFNSARLFIELPTDDIEKYNDFVLSTKYEYNKQKIFQDFLNKIYLNNKSKRIPLIFYYDNNITFLAPTLIENYTLKKSILESGYDINLLINNTITINGMNFKNLENIPIIFALKNLCSSDIFLHIIIHKSASVI